MNSERIELLVIKTKSTMTLDQPPQKDGTDTDYQCGVRFVGSWAGRIEQYRDFCNTPVGKYILKLERWKAEQMKVWLPVTEFMQHDPRLDIGDAIAERVLLDLQMYAGIRELLEKHLPQKSEKNETL